MAQAAAQLAAQAAGATSATQQGGPTAATQQAAQAAAQSAAQTAQSAQKAAESAAQTAQKAAEQAKSSAAAQQGGPTVAAQQGGPTTAAQQAAKAASLEQQVAALQKENQQLKSALSQAAAKDTSASSAAAAAAAAASAASKDAPSAAAAAGSARPQAGSAARADIKVAEQVTAPGQSSALAQIQGGQGSIEIVFPSGVTELDKEARAKLESSFASIVDKAKSSGLQLVSVPEAGGAYSEGRRLAYYRNLAVRNWLIERGVPAQSVKLRISDRDSGKPNAVLMISPATP